MAKSDIEENYDELKNSHKTSKIDVPMTFEHLYIFSKFRFSIPITIANKYICMKFAKCDGRTGGRTHGQTQGQINMINTVCLKKLIMLYSIGH